MHHLFWGGVVINILKWFPVEVLMNHSVTDDDLIFEEP